MATKNSLRFIIGILDAMMPKRHNRYSFFVTQGTSWDGNMQCLFASVSQNKAIECKVIYSCGKGKRSAPESCRMPAFSLSGWFYLLTSKTIIFDHACPPGLRRKNRCMINVWHGVPIKTIRFFDKGSFVSGYLQKQSNSTSLLVASSEIDRLAMSASFQIDPEHVKITGLPRNDLLINPEKFAGLLSTFSKEKDFLKNAIAGRKLILYAPTYRGNSSGLISDFKPSSSFENKLQRVLKRHDAIFAVRSHKFSENIRFQTIAATSHYLELSDEAISNTNILLSMTDILVTDYSSIWVDFLLTDRPIIGYFADSHNYLSERGFIYNFGETFPGIMTKTEDELIDAIEKQLANPCLPSLKHQQLKQQFHRFKDGLNTERTIKEIERHLQCLS